MSELDDIRVDMGYGNSSTMQQLVASWQRHIERLAKEMPGPIGDETWGAHDYFAALHMRDHVEFGRTGLDRRLDDLVGGAVAATDKLLLSISEEDDRGVALRYGGPGPSAPSRWWWHRILVGGLVREEVDLWFARSQSGWRPRYED